MDRHAELVRSAAVRLRQLGYTGINLRSGDGTLGWPEEAPFDAIIVTAGGPEIPETLSRQLKTSGRLVSRSGREAISEADCPAADGRRQFRGRGSGFRRLCAADRCPWLETR